MRSPAPWEDHPLLASPARNLAELPSSSIAPNSLLEPRVRTPAQTSRILEFDTPDRLHECYNMGEQLTASPYILSYQSTQGDRQDSDTDPSTGCHLSDTPLRDASRHVLLESSCSVDESQWDAQAPDRYRGSQMYSETGMVSGTTDFNTSRQSLPPLPVFENPQALGYVEQEDEIQRFLGGMDDGPKAVTPTVLHSPSVIPGRGSDSMPSSPRPASTSTIEKPKNPILDSSLWRSIAERDAQVWAEGLALIGAGGRTPSTTYSSSGHRSSIGNSPCSWDAGTSPEAHWEQQPSCIMRSHFATPQKSATEGWEQETYKGAVELQECSNCKRHFRPDRLLKHEAVCRSAFSTKAHRHVWDSKRQRTKEMEDHWWLHDSVKSPHRNVQHQHQSSSGSRRGIPSNSHSVAQLNSGKASHRTQSAPSRGKACSSRDIMPRGNLAEVPSMPRPKTEVSPVKLGTPPIGKGSTRHFSATPLRSRAAGSKASPSSEPSQKYASHPDSKHSALKDLMQSSPVLKPVGMSAKEASGLNELSFIHASSRRSIHKENVPPDVPTELFVQQSTHSSSFDNLSEQTRDEAAVFAQTASHLFSANANGRSRSRSPNSSVLRFVATCPGTQRKDTDHLENVKFPGDAGRYDIDTCIQQEMSSHITQHAECTCSDTSCRAASPPRQSLALDESSRRVVHSDNPSTPPRGGGCMQSRRQTPGEQQSPCRWGEDAPLVMPAVWSQRTPPSCGQGNNFVQNIPTGTYALGVAGTSRDLVNSDSGARSSDYSEVLAPMMKEVAALGMQVDQIMERRCPGSSLTAAHDSPQVSRPRYDPSRYSAPHLDTGGMQATPVLPSPAIEPTVELRDKPLHAGEGLDKLMCSPERRQLDLAAAMDRLEQQSLLMQDRVRECAQQIEERQRQWKQESLATEAAKAG